MRLGLMGGTFDPPHYGHLHLAEAAQQQLDLDQVLWVVAADPPHKQDQFITPVKDRLEMVAAMLADLPGHHISRVDVDRPGPHYTADTITLLAEQYPNEALYFLMGGDSLRDLPTWGRPEQILNHARLGVLRRPGAVIDLAELETELPGIARRVDFIDAPVLDISANEIRRRVAASQPLDGLVPPVVEAVIWERGLYP